jgi:hypothetical protein
VSAILFVLGLAATRAWLNARDASVYLAATLEAQSRIVAQANQRQQQRNAALAEQLQTIEQARRRVNTPARAAAELPLALPRTTRPVVVEIPPPTIENPVPPALLTIAQDDLEPLHGYLLDCRACQVSLAATRENLFDERLKLEAVTTQRDVAIAASRGGGFWSRLGANFKWFAVGAALGAGLAAAAAPF